MPFRQDQNGQIGLGHAANGRPQGLDRRAAADQPNSFGRLLDDMAVGDQQFLAVWVFSRATAAGSQFGEGQLSSSENRRRAC